ncbi:hypothetical protein NA57DRAFT_81867 [Rhizodiscina lignyota]|uniref:SnoaL-like domain-containing protein n=1 Tax=Rhizodiscina lignyota TaxID=1504668 RepID=A0A9P4I4R6_9PEZI|nr:hypothetical protein NA57DRAFT_81867 [Rhizodiscina lignyota]
MAPYETLYHSGPPTPDLLQHPVLSFYAKYGANFIKPNEFRDAPFDDFYSADTVFTETDGTIIHGGAVVWEHYDELFGPFQHTHDAKSFVLITDKEEEKYTLYIEDVTTFVPHGKTEGTTIPRFFIYTIRKADPGKGTDGFQICAIRNFFDKTPLQKYN